MELGHIYLLLVLSQVEKNKSLPREYNLMTLGHIFAYMNIHLISRITFDSKNYGFRYKGFVEANRV